MLQYQEQIRLLGASEPKNSVLLCTLCGEKGTNTMFLATFMITIKAAFFRITAVLHYR
jgi:hypothetical protein